MSNMNTHRLLKHVTLPTTQGTLDVEDRKSVIVALAQHRADARVRLPAMVDKFTIHYIRRATGTLIQYHNGKETQSDFVRYGVPNA